MQDTVRVGFVIEDAASPTVDNNGGLKNMYIYVLNAGYFPSRLCD